MVVILSPMVVILSPMVVILSPMVVVLSEAKDLLLSRTADPSLCSG